MRTLSTALLKLSKLYFSLTVVNLFFYDFLTQQVQMHNTMLISNPKHLTSKNLGYRFLISTVIQISTDL